MMSEFTSHREERIKGLLALFHSILKQDEPLNAIRQSEQLISEIIPSDIIFVVDELVKQEIPMVELKTGINKFLNQLHKAIKSYPGIQVKPGSLFDICQKNNNLLDERLKALRPAIKQLNMTPEDHELRSRIRSGLEELLQYNRYYKIKENIIFPLLEKHWPNFRCLSVMWSFHGDIRRDLNTQITKLEHSNYKIEHINRFLGRVYFNMYAIRFREEAILFPYALETIPECELDALLPECAEISFPYHNVLPTAKDATMKRDTISNVDRIDLETGALTSEQIRLIFNHLPVDITFVDEYNKVRFFSSPAKRIFTRSKAIIGREVNRCHPPESVHVVEEIVEAFRSGKENKASFWIRMKDEMLLIQYFAVRDEQGTYKGVIEVSQEISELKALSGERRLLQWKK